MRDQDGMSGMRLLDEIRELLVMVQEAQKNLEQRATDGHNLANELDLR